ncbi:MAG: hypothetical protein KatS3mg003_2017 [Candidatus Nitrosocaldaceae archaeon]|nr:MAG: hypothetical protein KatS3mg003_2017 [Candidatus Nitrosocaldaceae archaeon]
MYETYEPYKYIDAINTKKHITLIYEEPEWAKILEFRFIYNGIRNNEPSIYAMHDDVEYIEEEMRNFGIDVDNAKENGLLHIYKIPDPRDSDKPLIERANDIIQEITYGLSNYRVVCRLISNIDSVAAFIANISIEETYHRFFDKLNCKLICPYYISEIPQLIRKEWLVNILKNHHGVIFAPRFGYGIAFDLNKE